MSKRERILALGVMLLVVVVGLQMGVNRIRSGFKVKEDRISRLEKEVNQKNDIIFDGEMAAQSIQKVVPRSLSSNSDQASADYRVWLDQLVKQVGIENAVYKHTSSQPEKGAYDNHTFSINGVGTIRQLVELLYRFHEKDYLHRLRVVDIGVPNQAYKMELSLIVDAIGLNAAPKMNKSLATPSLRLQKPLDDYLNVITERNLFSPANHSPELAKSQSTQVSKNEAMEFDPGAKDPDGHQVEYVLSGTVPEGMKIDKRSGKLVWNPKELGEVEVLISARDNGIPSRQAVQKLAIKVVDPPPPPPKVKEEPKFDVASQAFITGLLAGGKQPEVWVQSRTEGKTLFLKVGDEMKLGSVVGKVVAIGANYAELETEGKRWIVGQDESIADAFRRKDED